MKPTLFVLVICTLSLGACASVQPHARADLAPPVVLDDVVVVDTPAPIARTVDVRQTKHTAAARERQFDAVRPRPSPSPGPRAQR